MEPSIFPCDSAGPAPPEAVATDASGETADSSRPRHLRVVPEPVGAAEADASAESGDPARSGRGIGSVTYLPMFIPGEQDDDGEREWPVGEEAFAPRVAAVMPVPTL
jgi:hypothetical protein